MYIAYDGTRYSGWQIQPNSISIQGQIENALKTLLKTEVRVIGAGRTDAGVHALGQVAHFCTPIEVNCERFLYALNGMLPSDIRIKKLFQVHSSFHAQYAAASKEYHYHLWLEKTIDPFYRFYRHHFFRADFSLDLTKKAADQFIGTHDFISFANVGANIKNTTRTLMRLDIVEQEGGIRFEFEGSGFLYKMVRNIVGVLLEVATAKRHYSQIPDLFAAKDRRKGAAAAPSRGLFLVKINYPEKYSINSTNDLK